MENNKQICIALIIKDEADYLDDWLHYHFNIGFDKVFLGINDDDGYRKYLPILGKYGDKITIYDLSGQEAMQRPFYNEIIDKEDYEWCAFIDTDEYITFKNTSKITNIKDFLKDKPKEITAYKFKWELYGDDDNVYFEDKPVTERFKRPLPPIYNTYDFPEQFHTKSMLHKSIRSHFDTNPHVVATDDYWLADGTKTNGSPFDSSLVRYDVYIRHYYTKTIDEWVRHKMGRSYADYKRFSNIDYYPLSTFFKYNNKTEDKLKYLKEHGIKYTE